jgi:hypothetical protein
MSRPLGAPASGVVATSAALSTSMARTAASSSSATYASVRSFARASATDPLASAAPSGASLAFGALRAQEGGSIFAGVEASAVSVPAALGLSTATSLEGRQPIEMAASRGNQAIRMACSSRRASGV